MKNALLEKPHCRLSNCIGRYSRLSDGSFRCERCDDHVNGDFRPMTDPKLQMARRICIAQGWAVGTVLFDGAVRAALAAIEECTERAAKLAIGWRDESKSSIDDGDQSIAAQKVRGAAIEMNAFARALRSGNHLKGPTDGHNDA